MLYKTTLTMMQRLLQAAGNDYIFYTSGKIEQGRFKELSRKFNVNYETGISRQSKSRRKKSGVATSCLHALNQAWLQNGKNEVWFVLMATDGVGRVHSRERLQDLRQKEFRLTTPDAHHELVYDGIGWSWKMTREHYQKYRERIHQIAALPPERRRVIEIDGDPCDVSIERLQDQLYSEPGFRLVRQQVGQLVTFLRAEWKRLRPSDGPQPQHRTFLPYVRFRPNDT